MTKHILIAGLFHETHTFLDETTPLSAFAARRGEQMAAARGDGSPLSGVWEVADAAGWQVVPVTDLRAVPSGTVEDEVVEAFWADVRAAVEQQTPVGIDGIFLVLHGAMAAVSVPDVEGEIIRRIRNLSACRDVPICGVLDLHGNISRPTIEMTQGLIAYRTNPHIDARAVTVDGARLLDRILTTGQQPVCVWERPPIMWPPTGTGTDDDPMRTLEGMARHIEQSDPDIVAVNVMGGFSFADTPDTGVSFAAVTFGDAGRARERLRELSQWAIAHRESGNVVDPPLAQRMPQILEHVAKCETPVVVVEPADNVGGGGPGDATTVLRALIDSKIENAAVVINDPETVTRLSSHTPGDVVRVAVGGKRNRLTEGSLELDVELLSTSDGRFDLEDRQSHLASMYGVHIDMGRCAVVRHGGVRILLTSQKTPPFDLGQLRSQGIEPESLSVIGVKAAVAHRRAYDKIAKASFTVDTLGPCSSDLRSFPFRKVQRPVFPLDV